MGFSYHAPWRSVPALRLLVAAALVLPGCSCEDDPGAASGAGRETTTSEGAPSAGTEEDEAATSPAPLLYVAPSTYDFSRNRRLLDRILAEPHGYYRFINARFAQRVCERFADVTGTLPAVNLHGDAHLEQYAITDEGRGLSDFDDSATGPCLLDLIRFGVSLYLACEANGWREEREALLDAFLDGYRSALEDPSQKPHKPRVVDRIRASFPSDRQPFLSEVEDLMKPLGFDASEIQRPFARYAATQHEQDSSIKEGFFHIKKLGRLTLGVGSALDEKYLARVEGPADSPVDDLVLEIKEVRDLTGIGCMDVSRRRDPFRILVGQSRISYRPYRYVGYMRWKGKTFWIHAWEDNYKEIDIHRSLESPEDLRAVVDDVAIQLGLGHPEGIADPLDLQLRRALVHVVDEHRERIRNQVAELTQETVAAWEHFRTVARPTAAR